MGWKNVLTPNAGPYTATVSFNPENYGVGTHGQYTQILYSGLSYGGLKFFETTCELDMNPTQN
jgi:hypothetical protein